MKGENECGTVNLITGLSIFSAITSCLLCLVTTPLTSILLAIIHSNKKNKFRGMFYKLLFNIAVADFLTATVVNVASIMFYVREALQLNIGEGNIYTMHLSLFLTDAVALVTMTMLSIDRILALTRPYSYRKGLKNSTENLLVFSSWFLGTLLVIPYFFISFIKELAIFTAVNVLIAIVFLVATLLVYRYKFLSPVGSNIYTSDAGNPVKSEFGVSSDSTRTIFERSDRVTFDSINTKEIDKYCESIGNACPTSPIEACNFPESNPKDTCPKTKLSEMTSVNNNVDDKRTQCKSRSNIQKRVTRTFLIMVVVFIVTYLPTCVLMIYMNVYTKCDCDLIHVMRDLSILSIASSSTLRSLNFILTLKHVREAIVQLCRDLCHGNQ